MRASTSGSSARGLTALESSITRMGVTARCYPLRDAQTGLERSRRCSPDCFTPQPSGRRNRPPHSQLPRGGAALDLSLQRCSMGSGRCPGPSLWPSPVAYTRQMIEVHVSFSGWRKFPEANAWGMHDDGTLRIVQTSGPPDYTFQRWVAVFAPGGWQGLTYDPD